MKVVIAPDSFKESLSAPEAAEQIAAGFREVFPMPTMSWCRWPMEARGQYRPWWPPPAAGLSRPCSLEDALANAAINISLTARNIAATIRLSRDLFPH